MEGTKSMRKKLWDLIGRRAQILLSGPVPAMGGLKVVEPGGHTCRYLGTTPLGSSVLRYLPTHGALPDTHLARVGRASPVRIHVTPQPYSFILQESLPLFSHCAPAVLKMLST